MKPITVNQWRTVFSRSVYTAPEVNPIALSGVVPPSADPRRPDGSPITTSEIVSVDGRIVTTRSGTRYRLGTIDPGFRAWLRKEGCPYNAKQPITIKAVRP